METPSDTLSPALEAVVSRYAGMVRAVGQRYRLADDDLEELLQDVRIRLWRSRGSGENIRQSPSSYVYRTAMSAALDLIRRRRARREDRVDVNRPSGEAAFGSAPPADVALSRAELAATVGRAVDSLIDSRRPVVRMYLTGYTREEIAHLLGWSEAKTRNLLYRGLEDLRRCLRGWNIDAETMP
jgi:RNA polymerase sigma-70 factor (ECF subfamily)